MTASGAALIDPRELCENCFELIQSCVCKSDDDNVETALGYLSNTHDMVLKLERDMESNNKYLTERLSTLSLREAQLAKELETQVFMLHKKFALVFMVIAIFFAMQAIACIVFLVHNWV